MASENIVENCSPGGHREAVEPGDQAFSSELPLSSCAALGKKKQLDCIEKLLCVMYFTCTFSVNPHKIPMRGVVPYLF